MLSGTVECIPEEVLVLGMKACIISIYTDPSGLAALRKPYSAKTSAPANLGALKTGSCPPPVLGKAITSLMLLDPARMATRRSKPRAMPP